MSKSLHKYSDYFRRIGLFKNIKSFKDLEKKIINLNVTPGRTERQTKGDAFEVFAEALINVSKKFNAKAVYPDGKIPIKILNKVEMNILDKGKDGVYLTKDNKINSYQVKFNSDRRSLSWRKLSTFLSVSEKANLRLLISNSNKIEDEFLSKRDVLSFNSHSLEALSKKEIASICEWLNQKKEKNKLPKPDPKYQIEALKKINDELKISNRTTTVMACGSGKTLVGLWTFEKIRPKLSVVFVPSIGLIKQIRADWLGNTSIEKLRTISICSSNDRSSREDEFDISQKDLDFKITLDSNEVKKFIDSKSNDLKVIFCTYQSSKIIHKAIGKKKIIDFAIFDEAHRTAKVSKHKKYNLNDLFSYALYDENIFIKKRLFMTATRRVEDRKNFNNAGDAKLTVSMDKESIYGKVCYPLTFFEAAKKNIIAKSKFIVSYVTSDEIEREQRRFSKTLIKGINIKTEQVADQIAIKKAVEKYKIKKLFTFHTTVNQAHSFTKNGPEGISNHLPNFFTASIDGKMRSRLRDARMQEFRENNSSLMANARCLIEGIDVPEVSMVAFVTPKQSEVDIVQATGRALRNRNQKNKKFGYVLIPIFIENKKGEKQSEAIQRTDYEKLANVIKAMGEHDEEIKQLISELLISENRGKGYGKRALKKFKERIEIIHPTISEKILLKHITSRTITKLITRWDEMLGMLYGYRDKHGNCDVPFNYSQNPELGKWVHVLRRRRLFGTLYDYQINQLNKIKFNWKLEGEDRTKGLQYVNIKIIAKELGTNIKSLKSLLKKSNINITSGYHTFKTSKSKKGIYSKSNFILFDDYKNLVSEFNLLKTKEIKKLLKNENFLKEDDFIKYCNLNSKIFYSLFSKYKIKPQYNYLGKGIKYFSRDKKDFYFLSMIFKKSQKKELEKLVGFKFIKPHSDIISRSKALNMGLHETDFLNKMKTYETKIIPAGVIVTNAGAGLEVVYSKNNIIQRLKDKNINLSKEQIIKDKLIDSRDMTKILYKETGLSTVFFKALNDKLLIPRGRGLRLGKKKVINYFLSNEIEKYKERTLKKYKIKKNEKFIFNYKDLSKKGIMTDEEVCKKLNCDINNLRSLRWSARINYDFRYAGKAASKNASYGTKNKTLNNFIIKYGKYIKNYKGLIPCNWEFKSILLGKDKVRKDGFESLIFNKKLKSSGFSFYQGKFVFLISYKELTNYIKKNKKNFGKKDISKLMIKLKKLVK